MPSLANRSVPSVAANQSKLTSARVQNTIFVCFLLLSGMLLYYFIQLYRLYFISLIIIFTFLAYLNWSTRQRTSLAYAAILLLGYGWLLIATFWSPERSEGHYKIAIEAIYFLFALFPVVASKFCTGDIKFRLLQTAALAYCGAAAAAFLLTGNVVDPSRPSIRTAFGAVFLGALPALVFLSLKRKSLLSLIILIAIGAISLTLKNRTLLLFGPLIFVASVIVVTREWLFVRRNLRQGLGMAILLIPVIAFAAGELVLSDAYSRFRSGTSLNIGRTVLREQFDSQHREDIERRIYTFVSINMFLEHPVFGAGYGSSSYYVHRVSQYRTVAHGLPFMLLAETGLVGASIFALIVLRSFTGFRLKLRSPLDPDERCMVWIELLTLVAILLVGLSHQIYDDFYFYLFLGTGLYYRGELKVGAPSTHHLRLVQT